MLTGPTKFYDAAKSVWVAVDAALTTPVDRSGVVPGLIVWDSVCGQLSVSIGRVYLSDNFPYEADVNTGNCQAAWEVNELIIQVVRCAPQPHDGQLAPEEDELDATAQIVARDAAETITALSEWVCQHTNVDVVDGVVLMADPQGPQGDGVATEFRLRLGFPRG